MKLKVFLLAVNLLVTACGLQAQGIGEVRRFADSLFLAGESASALPVYERVAFFMRPEIDPVVLERIGDCLIAGGDSEQAIGFYDHSFSAQPDDSLRRELTLKKTTCYLRAKNYRYALMELLGLEPAPGTGFERRRNFYLGMTWYGMEDFEKAGGFFEQAASSESERQQIREIFANPKQFKRPRPKLASWMSIVIPGSGQMYSGEVLAGVNSLLLTSFFIGLGYYVATVTSPVDALFTALPWFQRYYQGGFQRAAEMATTRRQENRNEIFNHIIDILGNE